MVPLIEGWRRSWARRVSVDTYKPAVARAAIAAGASIVNDVSGLRDPELADVCAQTGAALVLMHTIAPPKTKLPRPRPRRAHRRRRAALPRPAHRAGDVARRGLRTDHGRPRAGLLQDPGADGRRAAGAAGAARAGPAHPAGGQPQGLRRRAHPARRRGPGWPGRWPRWPMGRGRAPTCCASTTSPTRRTSSPSRRALAATARWSPGCACRTRCAGTQPVSDPAAR